MGKFRQRGEGKAGCIVGVIVLLVAVFVAMKVIPVRVSVSTLQDFIEETAQRAQLLNDTPDKPISAQIADKIFQKAREENLPVKLEDIKVSMANQRCSVDLRYTVDIDLAVYTYRWNVVHKVERLTF